MQRDVSGTFRLCMHTAFLSFYRNFGKVFQFLGKMYRGQGEQFIQNYRKEKYLRKKAPP